MRKFYLPLYSGLNALYKRSLKWITIAALLLISTGSFASHLAGGELTYRWLSGTTYVFTATLYRDCAGIVPTATLPFTYQSVSCGISGSSTMTEIAGTGQQISFPCGSALTTCNGGSNPGFQEWQYTDTVNIGGRCTDWVFSWIATARNAAITTIENPGSDNMYIDATLNNVSDTTASSPVFSNVPVALLCISQSFTYNQGALDPNGDSLSYSLIAPSIGPNNDSVTYEPGYSSVYPIASSPPATLNSSTGSILLYPTTVQVGITTVLVKKYHKGVLVGSVIRDMEFITENCGSNHLPTASGVNGTNVYGDTLCAAAGDTVCFNIISNDADVGQTVTMTWNNGIPTASFTTLGSPPVGTFCWKPTFADASSTPYNFTVTVRDNYCPENGIQVYTYTIYVPPIAVTINSSNIACYGGTANATATASGGISPYTYSWSTGSTTSSISGLVASTNYSVTATDSHGCTNSNTVDLTQPSAIIASIASQTNVSCHGQNNGSATVAASGGTGTLTSHWSNGQTSNPAINLAAGNYVDTVKDSNGCIALVFDTITQPTVLTAVISSQQNASCNGLANGQITVTASGGTRPYSYAWSPSVGSDSTVTGLGAGTYTVTITDNNGCTASKIDTITQPGVFVSLINDLTITGGIISCHGATNGSLSVSVSGGTSPYTYLWSPTGATTDTISNIGAGTYMVTVTDAHSCTADTSFALTQPDSLIATIPTFSTYFGGYNISCNGDNDGSVGVVVTGGTPGFQFAWSPGGQTAQNLDSLFAGTYSVTVTDTNGCSASASITLTQPAPLIITESSHHNVGCNGEASGSIGLSVTGGTPPYIYAWAPNASIDSVATGLVAGSYTVSVADQNGCVNSLVDSIVQPATVYPLIHAATVVGGLNIACSGDSTGTAWAVIDSGGTPPFQYSWSNGATTDTVNNLGAGPLSVFILDSNGCSITVYDTISQPEPVSASYALSYYLGGVNVSCSGSANGSITQTAIGGGTPGYTYTWNNGPTTPNDSNLMAGTYTVLITDTNGCKDSIAFTLVPPAPLANFLMSPQTNGGWNISCNGGSDGSITDSVAGGTSPYSFLWNTGDTTQNLGQFSSVPITAGIYIVTVTDANGCSQTDSITLTQPPALFDTLSAITHVGGNNISCYGGSDGSITDNVSGGTAPYSFSWNTGDTTQNLGLFSSVPIIAGTYVVTITDANGCSRMDSITLTQPDSISPNPVITPIKCYGGTGCINLTPTGGTAGYTYQWTPTEDSVSNFCDTAGTYQVIITDTNFCISVSYYTLTQPADLISSTVTSTFGGSNVSCNTSCDGTINVSVSGGVMPYTYSWSPNASSDSVATGLCAGTYTITVTDFDSCSTVNVVTLTAPPPITDSILTSVYAGGYNISCAGNDGSITIIPSGGTGPYTYVWSPNVSNDSVATGLDSARTYIISVTDANGCSVTDSVTLTQAGSFSFSDSLSNFNGYNISCNGATNGCIYAVLTGGVPPFSFHWSTGDTAQNICNLGAGTYIDTITFSGCMAIDSVTITGPQPLTAPSVTSNYNGSGVKCNGDSTSGFININTTGGTPGYTYVWSNGTTTQNLDSIGAGTYSVTVTDANGCTAIAFDTLTAPTPLTLPTVTVSNYNGSGVKCNGDTTTGFINITVSGGTPTYTYTWSNGSITQNLDSIGAGTYSVMVADANGCTATSSDTLTAPTPLTIPTLTASSYNGSGVKCNGDSTSGFINITVNGGTPSYTYTWSNGATTQNLDSIGAGTYSITVTDANGCSVMDTATLTSPPPINLNVIDSTFNGSGIKCSADTNGYIHLIVTGGTQPIAYTWSPNVSADSVATNLSQGTYSYTVTDANGCSSSNSTTLTGPQPINVNAVDSSYNGSGVKCNLDSSGYIHIIATGGTPAYTYSWNNGLPADSIESNLGAGTYTYTVTDMNGCSTSNAIVITSPQPVNITASDSSYNGSGVKCNNSTDGYIHLIVAGGTQPFSYTWSNSLPSDSIQNNLGAGNYSYTVTDVNGCTASGSQDLSNPPAISDSLSSPKLNATYNVSCNGDSTGTATVTATGGTNSYTYIWSNGETTQVATNLTAQTYSVTVSDGNGCTAAGSITLTQPPPLTASAGSDMLLCGTTTTLSATVSPGDTGTWSVQPVGSFSNIHDPNATVSGLDTATTSTLLWTVTDGVCFLSDTVTVTTFNQVSRANAGPGDSLCENAATSAMLHAGAIIGPGTGSWSSLGSASVINPGDSVTGVNNLVGGNNLFVWLVANGACSSSDTVSIYVDVTGDCDTLQMPTGFSPNGDGQNDLFVIHGIDKYPGNSFKVFNRWGNEVFSIDDYNNTSIVWSGNNNSGEPLPSGTYFAILTINNSSVHLRGYVDLRR